MMAMKMTMMLFVALLASSQASFDSTIHRIEFDVCVDVVGYLENGAVCGAVAEEATGFAAGLLAETGPFDLILDAIVYFAVKYLCEKAMHFFESFIHLNPSDICNDIMHSRHRQARVASRFPRSNNTATTTTTNTTKAKNLTALEAKYPDLASVEAAWSDAASARWFEIRQRKMMLHGIPVAVFADGTTGYCFIQPNTSFYNCMEHSEGIVDAFVNSTSAGVVANQMTQCTARNHLQTDSATSSSSPVNGLVSAIVVLSLALVVCVGYAGYLTHNLKRVVAESSVYQGGDDAYASALLTPTSGI